jgi:hypothetical protein
MSDKKLIEELFLKYSDVSNISEKANTNLEKIAIKNRLTAGREFRRDMRLLKSIIDECVKLSRELDKENRKAKGK